MTDFDFRMSESQRQLAYYYERKERGVCVRCGGELDRQGVNCSRCAKRLNDAQNRRYHEFVAGHQCRKCGKPLGKDDRYKACAECRLYERVHRKIWEKKGDNV